LLPTLRLSIKESKELHCRQQTFCPIGVECLLLSREYSV
jgi:hypothetical protein